MKFGWYLFQLVLLLLDLLCFFLYAILLLLQILYVLQDRVVYLGPHVVFELLVGLVFVNIYYLPLDFLLLLATLGDFFCLFLELVFGNVDQVRYVSGWFGIFWSLSCSKAEILLFLTYFSRGCLFVLSLTFLGLFYTLLPGEAVVLDISDSRFVDISELDKKFSHLPQRLDLDIFSFSFQKFLSNKLLLMLLLRSIGLIADPTPIRKSIMHCQLLLQLLDIFLILLQQQFGVQVDINRYLIADFHHPWCEFESRNSLLKMGGLRPDISYHTGLRIATNRIFQEIGQLVLPVRNVISLLVAQCNHNLLQKRQGFVDKLCLNQSPAFWAGFFGPFWACQIDQVDFGHDHLLTTLNFAPDLKMDGKDGVSPRAIFVQLMLSNSFIILPLKQNLLSIFLIISLPPGQPFDEDVSFMVLLDVEGIPVVLIQQIDQLLVVEFQIGNRYFYLMLISWVNFLVERRKDPGNDSPVFVVVLSPSHRKCLTCSSLTITEDSPWIPLQRRGEDFFRGKVVDNFLWGIVENFLELEAPLVLLMIDDTSLDGSFDMDVDVAEWRGSYPDCSSTFICWCAKLEVGRSRIITFTGAFFIM